MNALQTNVSFYAHFSDTNNPTTGTFLQVVASEKLAAKYAPLIERIRATVDKSERDKLKKQLPCFTPSGTFSRRAADGLLKHSGLIQFDIDSKENPALTAQNAPSLRDKIARFQHVAFCALSASGKGVWGVVPIAYPERHKEHFAALAADFAGWGIVIDPACSNVDRLRFWSYDPAAHFRPEAVNYTRLQNERPDKYTPNYRQPATTGNAEKVEMLTAQIEATRTDITSGGNGYDEWFAIGSALANEFGESGRDYFHRIGQYYPGYDSHETDRQFSYCLQMKSNRYTLGTLFEIARRYGIEYKGLYSQRPENGAHSALKQPTPHLETRSALPPGYKRERYTDRDTGLPIEVLLNADGYPAAWDLTDSQQAALSKMIKTAPTITELIARFDLKPCPLVGENV